MKSYNMHEISKSIVGLSKDTFSIKRLNQTVKIDTKKGRPKGA